MSGLVLRDVEVDGRRADVHVVGDRVVAVAPAGSRGPSADVDVIDGGGGALIPGLHDHHVHLFATAALDRSVMCGPPAVRDRAALAAALAAAPGTGWVRGVGYHESVAGDLDRHDLDRLVADRPVRLQHRGGLQWVLNSAAAEAIGLVDGPTPDGVERDSSGAPTGRLRRVDGWLRSRLPPEPPPDVAALSRRLLTCGVTGLTDATPVTTTGELDALATAGVVQHLQVTGGPALADLPAPTGAGRGPVKVVLDDHDLPGLDDLAGWFRRAHDAGRAVAVHCVTRLQLVLSLAAWHEAGARLGDRVEHGSVIPVELLADLARLGLTVVTQPRFVAERGDDYRRDVDPDDQPDLYRCASLLDVGIPVAGSTDMPYGDPDPWRAIVAAVERRTRSGHVLGPAERLAPAAALDLFLTPLADPGGSPRRVVAGAAADLVLLHAPLAEVLAAPTSDAVRTTILGGVPLA